MTFKEISFQDDLRFASRESDKTFLQGLLQSQSPIMKVWFGLMLLNLVLLLFIIH